MRKKLVIFALLTILISPLLVYVIKAYEPKGLFPQKDLPCINLRKYSVGDLLEKNRISDDDTSFSLRKYPAGNVNSMEGLSNLPNPENIELLNLGETCIKRISDIEKLTNLKLLYMTDTKLNSLDGLENMNNLEELYVTGTNIDTISGIENIRTDPTKHLMIWFDSRKVRYITTESYDYVMNPENNVELILQDGEGMFAYTFGYTDLGTYQELVDENLLEKV